MTAGNNRKENTFKPKPQPEPEFVVEREIVAEEPIKEEKPKKETPKKAEKTPKNKEPKAERQKKEPKTSDSKIKRIIGVLFICLAIYLFIAMLSYFFSFFSGNHQEYGYQVFNEKIQLDNRTGRLGAFLSQTLIKIPTHLRRTPSACLKDGRTQQNSSFHPRSQRRADAGTGPHREHPPREPQRH